ncbi:hypothetical protein CEP50_15585 [Actinopolyspora mortivallis]|uniref:Uncharacterized protein n=1 Tax=Actinopolyspora mortivallis TaxID=33906 RepID=A0A2T0GTF5_ACTMO|nr:hypothetical protein CEP50_15585 [Actinopolyspora mortivallis]
MKRAVSVRPEPGSNSPTNNQRKNPSNKHSKKPQDPHGPHTHTKQGTVEFSKNTPTTVGFPSTGTSSPASERQPL